MSSRWRVCFTSGDRLLWASAGPNFGGAILSAAITIERSTRISIRVTALNAMCSMNHLMWARIWLQNRKHRVMSSGSLEVMHILSCNIHVICTLKTMRNTGYGFLQAGLKFLWRYGNDLSVKLCFDILHLNLLAAVGMHDRIIWIGSQIKPRTILPSKPMPLIKHFFLGHGHEYKEALASESFVWLTALHPYTLVFPEACPCCDRKDII